MKKTLALLMSALLGAVLLASMVFTVSSATGGFSSNFNGSSTGWSQVKGNWIIYNSQFYYSNGVTNKYSSSRHTGTYSNFTYQAKLKRAGACLDCPNGLIIRGRPTSFDTAYRWSPSYMFQYSNDGYFSVYEITSLATSIPLKTRTASPAIVRKGWNILKVIANGNSLKYYINGTLVWSGTDITLQSGTVGVEFYRNSYAGTLYVDSAVLSVIADTNPFDLGPEAAPKDEPPSP